MAEWGRTNVSYADRVKHLNGSLAGGLNGNVRLTPDTDYNDSAVDSLFGQGDLDWFFASLVSPKQDKIKDAARLDMITVVWAGRLSNLLTQQARADISFGSGLLMRPNVRGHSPEAQDGFRGDGTFHIRIGQDRAPRTSLTAFAIGTASPHHGEHPGPVRRRQVLPDSPRYAVAPRVACPSCGSTSDGMVVRAVL
ncbi:hypothetical protein ACYOEI_07640 [Singulisphaera rosea]